MLTMRTYFKFNLRRKQSYVPQEHEAEKVDKQTLRWHLISHDQMAFGTPDGYHREIAMWPKSRNMLTEKSTICQDTKQDLDT